MAKMVAECATKGIVYSLVLLGVLLSAFETSMAARIDSSLYGNALHQHQSIGFIESSARLSRAEPLQISLYPWNDHLGRELKIEWSAREVEQNECKPIAPKFLGKVRSVNTYDQCVVLFSRDGCRGPYRVIKKDSPSHNRLSDLCFHRRTTSVRPCTSEEKQS